MKFKELVAVIAAIAVIAAFIVVVNIPVGNYMEFWLIFGAVIISVIALTTRSRLADAEYIFGFLYGIFVVVLVLVNSEMVLGKKLSKAIYVEDVNTSSILFTDHRTVTKKMAFQMANKIIGKKVNGVQISSQYEISWDMSSVQKVGGKLVWVMPLDYSGFMKWYNQEYIPGYIIVSATNPKEKPILKLGHKMSVSQGSFFLDNIDRLAYFRSGFKKVETHFEVNDKGHPYFVSLVLKPSLLLKAMKTESVIVTDAESGEYKEIPYKEILKMKEYQWIDRLVSSKEVDKQLNWLGTLSNGWVNKILEGKNVVIPTQYNGREIWITHVNGAQNYFTGMTSTNQKDNSLVYGIVVDTRTGKGRRFDLSGIMDEAGAMDAISSALGINAQKWDPQLPQPLVVSGKFYWGASVVSHSNIFQKVAVVDGENQSKVYFAETYSDIIKKIQSPEKEFFEEDSQPEFVKVRKDVLEKILQKIDEIQKLKELLMK